MTNGEIQYDVKVKNAFKRYGSNSVIKGLSMNVKLGSIYGLLGPSGCGKTTFLQCILGLMPLDSGSIDLKANCRKDIGYMPQELCLEKTLTVKEILVYYGYLYKMSNNDIDRRIRKINKFLHLPNLNSNLTEISGGQSRRVSLAISILHDPKIIVLDEPTVGIDPILREEIWAEFVKMTNQHKKTIIITTHYIEEASLSDCIGLMRKGILVEEGSPQYILNKYGTDSLEESFLKACCSQETNQTNHDPVQVQEKIQSNKLTRFESNTSLYRIKALLKKNIYVCSRDYVLLYTMIILPIILSILYCYGIGGHLKHMIVTVKNEEINFLDCPSANTSGCIFDENYNQTMSCVILNYLQSLDYTLTASRMTFKKASSISCDRQRLFEIKGHCITYELIFRFILVVRQKVSSTTNRKDESMKKIEVKDREGGEMSINIPNHMAFLYFPKTFTKDLTIYINDRENYANLTYAHITKENFLLRTQIKMDILDSINYLTEETLKACSYSPKVSKIPIEFNRVFGQEVKTISNSVITVFLTLMIFYLSSVFSSSIMMAEKMDGTLSRSMFAGVKVPELLMSMFCIDTIIILIQMFVMFSISFVLFSNPIQKTNCLIIYVILMLIVGWIGFFFGLIAAVLAPTKIGGVYIIIAMAFGQFYLSGIIWPLDGQPELVRKLSEIIPIRIVGYTVNNIALKGWTIDHPSIITGTTASFVYTILLVLILFILGKFKKDLWVIHK